MAHEHEHADAVVAVDGGGLAHGEEVAERLAHLLVVDVDKAVVQPVVDELAAVGGLGLGDLVLVVREGEVAAAAVDVDRLAEVAVGHGRALNVPAGAALAPRRGPERLAGFGGLPEREVERVFLDVVDVDSRAGLQVLDRLVAELAVVLELQRAVVHVAVDLVGVALVDERRDEVDDLLDVFGGLRVHGRLADAERVRVGEVLGDVLFRDLLAGDALLVGALDDLVVHVGEVLHERHLVAAVLQIAAQHVEHDDRARVADVDVVIHRRAAGIHAHFARLDRHELFLLHGHGVVQFHIQAPLRRICNKKAPPCRPA